MTISPLALDSLDAAVDLLLTRTGNTLRMAAPLGLGKPHRLLNAITRRVSAQPDLQLKLYTALSLTPPTPRSDIEKRFMGPFLARHFGADFPALDYALAMRRDNLPANIEVEEFYFQSGGLLGASHAQRHYNSLNYTHVARAVAERGVNVLVQLVAREPGGQRLSLSCNPDLTLDLLNELAELGLPRPLIIAEVHPDLPFMDGDAALDPGFFDAVLDLPGPAPQLFALPREPVGDADYAIGLYASTLVRDGGSLQIGIGALSDALTHALVLRHTRNDTYRALIKALWPDVEHSPIVCRWGGLGPFEQGLFGASEMVMDGFMHLIEAGVIKRRVVDDIELMQRVFEHRADDADLARLETEGQHLHGGFFLGSKDLYRWLRELPPRERERIGMTRISHINELYGGQETLERLQRREARFFNTCMMMNLLGAATSDALDNGQVVSGVGGQYNFVAMAQALRESRSALMLRAVRESGGKTSSNVVWNYGHTTIPRHLRDVAITEYGIADLRGRSDEDCIRAMLAISDARFEPALAQSAITAGKLAVKGGYESIAGNTPEHITRILAPFRASGDLPDYPLGSDFTAVEQRLVKALGWLKRNTATPKLKLATICRALLASSPDDPEAMARMGLGAAAGLREKLLARLLRYALNSQ
ncbi:MAG: acetyl-CoA hydrolase [Gammaproteobacteria bacterium HGW-Gammaproteobacteria-2]|jgi:acyl-CoA hydrolase|nr:MAG: acetyl-CoA hydrolase [Gammaproteobacteria bacterium HGW-Gammaproteobacteria-2]